MVVESSGTQTATVGSEVTLVSPSTAKTRVLVVDVAALTSTETVELRVKAPVLAAGTTQLVQLATFAAGVTDSNTQSPPVVMPQGGTFTLKQVGGTARAFPWAVITLD